MKLSRHRLAAFRALSVCALILPVCVTSASMPSALVIEATPLLPGESIPMDGTVSHLAWRRAPAFSGFVELEPVNGALPKFETRVQVLVGDSALYVGIVARDPAPALIREELVRHDCIQRSQDMVALYVDPMGQSSGAQVFRVGVGGSTTDGIRTAADDGEDLAPDFDWDSAVVRTTDGYEMVFRIPFACLRYTGTGKGPWRILVVRQVPRDVVYQLSSAPIPLDSSSIVSRMQPLNGVTIPDGGGFLTVRPRVMVRQERESMSGGPNTSDIKVDHGLDLKWRPRPELVVDVTLRPDFSQVGRDVPELTRNTTFAIFREERRPFFLEGSDLLRSPVSALWTGTITLPSWGVRATMRTDAASGTAFITGDKGGGVVLLPSVYRTEFAAQPASYAAIARVRSDRENLEMGGLASLRSYENNRGSNIVVGPDVTWQVSDNLKLRGQLLASSTSAQPDGASGLQKDQGVLGHYCYLNVYWGVEHHEIYAIAEDISSGFRDDNGFIEQTGVTRLNGYYNRNFRNLGPLNSLTMSVSGAAVRDKATDRLVAGTVIPNFTSSFGTSELVFEYIGWSHVRMSDEAELLRERFCRATYSQDISAWLPQLQVTADVGRLADFSTKSVRQGSRLTAGARLRPVRRLELEVNSSSATLRDDGRRVFEEQAHQLLAVWHLTGKQSLRLVAQLTSFERMAEPVHGIAATRDKTRADSLIYAWRKSAGTTLHIGATRLRSGSGGDASSSSEVFVKLQFDISKTLKARR